MKLIDCTHCGGSGKVPAPCDLCKGTGYVAEHLSRDYGDGYGMAGLSLKRCPRGCPPPIPRNTLAASGSTRTAADEKQRCPHEGDDPASFLGNRPDDCPNEVCRCLFRSAFLMAPEPKEKP